MDNDNDGLQWTLERFPTRDEATDAGGPPNDMIKAMYISRASEVRSCLKAAAKLGLGVSVKNMYIQEPDVEGQTEEWVLVLTPEPSFEVDE